MSNGLERPRRNPYLDEEAARPMRRVAARLADVALFATTYLYWWLVFAYAAWWLVALARGQTPGKQMLGMAAVKSDGTRFGWGRMFVREAFKEIYWIFTFGLGALLDIGLLLLHEQPRTIADRVTGSTIVHSSALQS